MHFMINYKIIKMLFSLEFTEQFLDFNALKQEFRKIGATFITAGMIGIFLSHLISLILALWLIFIGFCFLLLGVFKLKKYRGDL